MIIKLYAGEGKPGGRAVSVANLGCSAAYNWDYPAALSGAPAAGIDVWPLVQLTDGSRDRFLAWAREHPISHVMIENEPFAQKNLTPAQAARRVNEEILPAVNQCCPQARRVVGGFLVQYPVLYPAIRGRARELVQGIGAGGDVIAFHLYLNESPRMDEVAPLAEWFRRQVEGIAKDWPLFAVTEWGVLHCGYSGRDVPALEEYMRRTWDALLSRDCYAAAWYIAAPNRFVSAFADMALCHDNGAPKPLGLTYRELPLAKPVIEPEPAQPPPEGEEWTVFVDHSWQTAGRTWHALVRSKGVME
ncbi:MAG: hypothetical protein GXY76_16795 [Chloroflexi bacterium]|mgnify:CR=1 FL=1|nr:hypothetical protein [Chloroflexota bacterium]